VLEGCDGLDLIKDMKARQPELPLLVLSMQDEDVYAERALRAGALGYIMKDEAAENIITAIRRVLAGKVYVSQRAVRTIEIALPHRGEFEGGWTSPEEAIDVHVLAGEHRVGKRGPHAVVLDDERILGDGDFVEEGLSKSQEQLEKKYKLKAQGYDLEAVAAQVANMLGVKTSEIWAPGRERKRVEARSLFCYWAVRELGYSMAELSRELKLSLAGISKSVKRGERIASENGFELLI